MTRFIQDSNYIHQDNVLKLIYERAVAKFFDEAGERVVFNDLADYIKRQLIWKKQDIYTHGLPLLKEVCNKISENFDNGCEFACPDARNYRDVYFNVFE